MTDKELAQHDSKTLLQLLLSADARCDALTAERDAAYALGYSDAETEISKSALGQRVAFLNAEYSNAVHRIKDLNELLDEAETEWSNYESAWMTAEGKLADVEAERDRLRAIGTEMAESIEGNYYLPGVATRWRAALKGETP